MRNVCAFVREDGISPGAPGDVEEALAEDRDGLGREGAVTMAFLSPPEGRVDPDPGGGSKRMARSAEVEGTTLTTAFVPRIVAA